MTSALDYPPTKLGYKPPTFDVWAREPGKRAQLVGRRLVYEHAITTRNRLTAADPGHVYTVRPHRNGATR